MKKLSKRYEVITHQFSFLKFGMVVKVHMKFDRLDAAQFFADVHNNHMSGPQYLVYDSKKGDIV